MTAPTTQKVDYNLGAVIPRVRKIAESVGPMFGVSTVLGWRAKARDMTGHPAGLALDFMVTGSKGDALNAHLIENRQRYGLKYTLWKQAEYSAQTKWQPKRMEDRGSDTQNHIDHVHAQFKATGGWTTGHGENAIDPPEGWAEGESFGERVADNYADAFLPDWFGGVQELALKVVGIGAAAALFIVGARSAVSSMKE